MSLQMSQTRDKLKAPSAAAFATFVQLASN